MTKRYEIRYVDNTNIYKWYCNDEEIKDPHIIETALHQQNKEIQYWKHKVVSLLFILGKYKPTDEIRELLLELDKDGHNLNCEIFGSEYDD